MLNDSSCPLGHNTPLPLERSPPASFKRLLGINPAIPSRIGFGGTVARMGAERLFALAHDFASSGIGDSLMVPILQTIDNSVKPHPTSGLATEVITDGLFDERTRLARTTALRRHLALERDGVAHLDVETPQERAAMRTRNAVFTLPVRILLEHRIAAAAMN